MPEKRSEKSTYLSRYGGGYVSPAQFLAEFMCARQAARQGKSLPLRFWTLPAWEREFRNQLRLANGLLKLYLPEAVSLVLRSKQGRNVYSLGAKWIDPAVAAEDARLRALAALAVPEAEREPAEPPRAPEPPRPAFVATKSPLSRLKELE